MRTLVISGTWGQNAKEQPIKESESLNRSIEGTTRANIFNGGTCDRLRAIMSLASEYDRLIWLPVFTNKDDSVNPTQYVHDKTAIFA